MEFIFGPRKKREREPDPVPDTRISAPPIKMRALLIVHNPIIEQAGGRKLTEVLGWHNPYKLANQYVEDLWQASGNIANYRIVEKIEIDGYPVKLDGFRYDDERFMRNWWQRSGFHQPDAVDYNALIQEFDLIGRVARDEIDEVWLFAFPYAGYYESTMVGAGAYWCNSPPVPNTGHSAKRFVIMGFNYERDVGCMLESFGHRVESVMEHVYRGLPDQRNLWRRFSRFERDSPGKAALGNVHFAPSSVADYDWGNTRKVLSEADAWLKFPDLNTPPRQIQAQEWGGGDMRAHHLWWLKHLPRVEGSTDGISNNWWEYVLRP
jgi:hypothetical protein